MLGAEAHADHACRNSPQNRPTAQEFQGPGKSKRFVAGKNSRDHIVLDGELSSLRRASGKSSAPLDGRKVSFGWRTQQKHAAKYVCRRDRVLNGEIDAHPSNRRHGMSRIADAEESWPVPSRK